MTKRKKYHEPAIPGPITHWNIVTELQINGRNVEPGTELKISKERGRFRFVKFVRTGAGVEWVDVWGGKKGAEQMRSFRIDRVKTVHYKNKTDGNLAKAYKERQVQKKIEAFTEE
jgi:hypothetical protein